MTGRSIWLSSLSASNDSLEGRLVERFLLNRVGNANLDANQINAAKQLISKSFEMSDGLSFCLSTECDLLSQWRGYADDGSGFAIGFSKSYFENEFIPANQSCEPPITLEKVVYEDIEANESDFLNEIFEILMKAVQSKDKKIDNIIKLMRRRFTIKNDAFKEESEWRLLTFFLNKQGHDHMEYRPSGNQLTPYLPLELINQSKAITTVVIGPKNVTPKPILEKFISKCRFADVDVTKSRATYR